MTEYFYHGTSSILLDGIRKDGLRFPRQWHPWVRKAVFLTTSARRANLYARWRCRCSGSGGLGIPVTGEKYFWWQGQNGIPTVLRVPKDRLLGRLKYDWVGALQGFFYQCAYYEEIPSEYLEVRVGNRWQPL